MVTRDPEALKERARNLGKLNGLRMALVDLVPAGPPGPPTAAELEVRLWNANRSAEILAAATADVRVARAIFPIQGGSRLIAGPDPGQVRVTGVAAGADQTTIRLTIEPI